MSRLFFAFINKFFMQNHIRKIREEKKLTLQQVAKAMGVTKAQVSKMERGIIRLNDFWLDKLSELYKCSIHDLIDDDETQNFFREKNTNDRNSNAFCDATMLGNIDAKQIGFVEYCDLAKQYDLRFSKLQHDGQFFVFNLKGDFSDLYKDGTQLVFLTLNEKNKYLLKNGSVVLCRQKDKSGKSEGDFLRLIEKDEYGFFHAVYKIKYGRHSYSTPVRSLLAGEVGISGLIDLYSEMDKHPSKSKPTNKEIHLKNHEFDLMAVLVKAIVEIN